MGTYCDMPVCDLRFLDNAEAYREIEGISNVALLILPKDASPEMAAAIAAIPLSDVATTLYLGKNEQISTRNGFCVLSDNDFHEDGNSVLIVNGFAIVDTLRKSTKGSIAVNGMLIFKGSDQDCGLNFLMVNGMKLAIDFNGYKMMQNLEIDKEFLSFLKPKTLLVGAQNLTVHKDVTVEDLQNSQAILLAGMNLKCYPAVAAYVKATGYAGMNIEICND